jgi:hypothetical protein
MAFDQIERIDKVDQQIRIGGDEQRSPAGPIAEHRTGPFILELRMAQRSTPLAWISRPHLDKLLDEGTTPRHQIGAHPRVLNRDPLAYREGHAAARREKLDELTRLSEDLAGGYQ